MPKTYSPAIRDATRLAYIHSQFKTLAELRRNFGIGCKKTLRRWIEEGGWDEQRAEIEAKVAENVTKRVAETQEAMDRRHYGIWNLITKEIIARLRESQEAREFDAERQSKAPKGSKVRPSPGRLKPHEINALALTMRQVQLGQRLCLGIDADARDDGPQNIVNFFLDPSFQNYARKEEESRIVDVSAEELEI